MLISCTSITFVVCPTILALALASLKQKNDTSSKQSSPKVVLQITIYFWVQSKRYTLMLGLQSKGLPKINYKFSINVIEEKSEKIFYNHSSPSLHPNTHPPPIFQMHQNLTLVPRLHLPFLNKLSLAQAGLKMLLIIKNNNKFN